jgi:tetratricopeptide (TPR) repeat protein
MFANTMTAEHHTCKSRRGAAASGGWVALLVGLGLGVTAPGGARALGGLGGDLQAQILYGYQTEDRARLGELRETLAPLVHGADGDDALRYQLAHVDYRYAALVVADGDPRGAEAALAECVAATATLLKHDALSAEALALDAACRGGLAKFRKVQGVVLRAQSASHLAAAYKLAPGNPRVLLLLAYAALAAAGTAADRPDAPHGEAALQALERAAERFEATPATDPDVPGWGHAEAYLALGREYLARGDVLAARNWIEKALIAAPDYKAAQRALAELHNASAHS